MGYYTKYFYTYRAQISRTKETIIYVVAKYNHTSKDNGFINENISGCTGSGSFVTKLIPKLINGVEKSTTALRSDEMVISQMPSSAF